MATEAQHDAAEAVRAGWRLAWLGYQAPGSGVALGRGFPLGEVSGSTDAPTRAGGDNPPGEEDQCTKAERRWGIGVGLGSGWVPE
jgi:hypothetical protein